MPKLADFKAPEVVSIEGLVEIILNKIKETVAEPKIYDLGCGKNCAPGFMGVDFYCEADVRADLVNGDWDFADDGSVDLFYSSHFVEHVPDWNAFFTKAHAKLKDGGFMVITTPFGNSDRAWQDPDHKQVITRNRYYYLNREQRERMGVGHYGFAGNFELLEMFPVWNRDFAGLGEAQRMYALEHTWNAVDDLTVLLRKA